MIQSNICRIAPYRIMLVQSHYNSRTAACRSNALHKGLSTPGKKLLPETATLLQHLSKSPFLATICCRFLSATLLPDVDRP